MSPQRENARSPAKINWFLRVLKRRDDGYHDIESLMSCISLFDDLFFAFDQPRISVHCQHPEVPEDGTNLAFRAARLFFQRLSLDEGVSITIDKRIPVGAGLGGGSSNAATVLRVLNRRYRKPFAEPALKEMGLSLGADIPFFLKGRPALVHGIGESVRIVNGLPCVPLVLVKPEFSVATKWAYKNLNLALTKGPNRHKYDLLKDWKFDFRHHLCNDLETVTERKYPEISIIKRSLVDHGAAGALMSGSGPTVFGCFPDRDTARKAYQTLSRNREWQLFLAETIV
ncbi:MAG: 4-(cytidine 5'-diphospho)-2-C-methyl-D-erythritol kinase [Desulfobacteraceae bacterium]|jgi:4-diphosphocytidyl-2-C-methyl-D-erythritol kinase|nr:4-(cytidine 5'-diphospho)-2-C-methyl-D-erythritol kinase [Desulfobacteraceae bacterium]